jgi:hypothetical protein
MPAPFCKPASIVCRAVINQLNNDLSEFAAAIAARLLGAELPPPQLPAGRGTKSLHFHVSQDDRRSHFTGGGQTGSVAKHSGTLTLSLAAQARLPGGARNV